MFCGEITLNITSCLFQMLLYTKKADSNIPTLLLDISFKSLTYILFGLCTNTSSLLSVDLPIKAIKTYLKYLKHIVNLNEKHQETSNSPRSITTRWSQSINKRVITILDVDRKLEKTYKEITALIM